MSRFGARVGVLGTRAVRASAVAALAVLAIGLVAGLVRVLPWLVAPSVPIRVALPFARGLVAVALETALVAGPPVGWAYAAALLVERGEARALFALGAGPLRIVRGTLAPAMLFAALAAGAAGAWGTDAAAPGRLARELVLQSRQACTGDQPQARAVDVPLVHASWLCFPGAPPRLAAALPGSSGSLFTAASLWVSDDLRDVELTGFEARLGDGAQMRVRASRASIRGLAPWARASNLRPVVRALLLGASGALAALLAAFFVLAGGHAARLSALALGIAGPVAAVVVLSSLERETTRPLAYLSVPAAALTAVLAAAAIVGLAPRLARRRAPRSALPRTS